MSDKDVVIAANLIAAEANITGDGELTDRLRRAMMAGKDQWMFTDEDVRFRGSVGAVLFSATEEERERIAAELRALRDVSSLLSGVPVDISRIEPPDSPIGLMKLWREVKEQA